MLKKERHIGIFFINLAIFILLLLLHFSGITNIKISGASLMLVLPMLTAFSMFFDELYAAFTGLAVGICMDAFTSGTYCFNALSLMLLGLAVSFTAHYLFNRNIRSALVLSFFYCAVYYFFRWLCFYAFDSGVEDSFIYLFRYGFPSAVYSALFVVPFYFLERFFYKKRGFA